jgi:hypothetical protein
MAYSLFTLKSTGKVLDIKTFNNVADLIDDTLIDRSRNRNDGTLSNVTFTQSETNLYVMDFNGTTSYAEIPDSKSMRLTTGGTLLAWIYPRTLGNLDYGRIFDKSTDTASTNGYSLWLEPNNKISLVINGDFANQLLSIENAITLNEWNYVVATFDTTGRHLYINGIDVTVSGSDQTALPPNIAGMTSIGNRAGTPDRGFDGYISSPKIWSFALSQSQVIRRYEISIYSLIINEDIDAGTFTDTLTLYPILAGLFGETITENSIDGGVF